VPRRVWPFQWIEGGWLLALSALLTAATVWLVRRRATTAPDDSNPGGLFRLYSVGVILVLSLDD
jgi:hypothetical protein